jgi:phosphatidylserine/phosphatidylglycerophosphate/cardiolipin synthase-like enzyme
VRIRRVIVISAVALWAATAAWHTWKPLPPGTHVATPWQAIEPDEVRFIADVTTADGSGRPVVSQAIFDEALALVRSAREFVVLDFFLFNAHRGAQTGSGPVASPRALSRELTDTLIERKRADPGLQVLVITDPINDVYGASPAPHFARLRAEGIDVVRTDLGELRDPNPAWSSFWRLALGWWLDVVDARWLPHPFEPPGEAATPGAWARLVNFKANHRKVLLADDGRGGLAGLVSSANPHDASGAHSNVAMKLSGAVLEPLLASELAIAAFSGWDGALRRSGGVSSPMVRASLRGQRDEAVSLPDLADGRVVAARVLTEGAIREAIVERLEAAVRGDSVSVAMFYLAERDVVQALLAASGRGVEVRLILDPNKDAFGRTKSGIPNRQVAGELVARSDGAIKVRWYRTHGEQFHTKMVAIRGTDRLWLTAGSANLTRRNVRDYNLEANVAIEAGTDTAIAAQVFEYFDTLWSNRAPLGIEYTADFDAYADPSQLRYWQYRVMEATGLSSF